jgi:enoyl-CoA hydratase/carnithine racemase
MTSPTSGRSPRSTSDEVLFEQRGHVGVITLNRPAKLNAVTQEMSDALVGLARFCNDSDDVRAVVLTGAGDRAFCVGSDIAELDRYATPWAFRNREDYCDSLKVLRKPVIAAVNGYALGGGLETALICDIRLASTTATFAAAEVKLGWIGGGGMSALLDRSIGPSNASVMLMTGDPVDAERALAWGLVSEVLAPGKCSRAHWSWPGPSPAAHRSRSRPPRPTSRPPPTCPSSRPSPTSATSRPCASPPATLPRAAPPSPRSARRDSLGPDGGTTR